MKNSSCQGISCLQFWNSSTLCYCVAILFIVAMKKVFRRTGVWRQGLYPCTSTKAETTEKEPCHNKSPRFNQVWHWGKVVEWKKIRLLSVYYLEDCHQKPWIHKPRFILVLTRKSVISLDWLLAFVVIIAYLFACSFYVFQEVLMAQAMY